MWILILAWTLIAFALAFPIGRALGRRRRRAELMAACGIVRRGP